MKQLCTEDLGGPGLYGEGGNFVGNNKYESSKWLCQACGLGVREDQDHLGQSSGYRDLLQARDLDNDSGLVDFYTLVMERRKKRGWN